MENYKHLFRLSKRPGFDVHLRGELKKKTLAIFNREKYPTMDRESYIHKNAPKNDYIVWTPYLESLFELVEYILENKDTVLQHPSQLLQGGSGLGVGEVIREGNASRYNRETHLPTPFSGENQPLWFGIDRFNTDNYKRPGGVSSRHTLLDKTRNEEKQVWLVNLDGGVVENCGVLTEGKKIHLLNTRLMNLLYNVVDNYIKIKDPNILLSYGMIDKTIFRNNTRKRKATEISGTRGSTFTADRIATVYFFAVFELVEFVLNYGETDAKKQHCIVGYYHSPLLFLDVAKDIEEYKQSECVTIYGEVALNYKKLSDTADPILDETKTVETFHPLEKTKAGGTRKKKSNKTYKRSKPRR